MTTLGEVRGTLLESSRDGVIGKYEQEGFQVYAPIEVHDRCKHDQDEPALEREGGGARDPIVAVQQALFKKLESVVQCIKGHVGMQDADGGATPPPQAADDCHVQAVAWHPYQQRLAIAMRGKNRACSARIYDVARQQWLDVQLDHAFQLDVTCMEWAPLSGATLAVGGVGGVCLWRLLPAASSQHQHQQGVGGSGGIGGGVTGMAALPGTRHEAAWMRFVRHPAQHTVEALAWAPNGRIMATASPDDGCVLLWDLACASPEPLTPLRQLGGASSAIVLSWAPDGSCLVAATNASTIAMWETPEAADGEAWVGWRNRIEGHSWHGLKGPCGAAAWCPRSETMLMAWGAEIASLHVPEPLERGARLGFGDQAWTVLPAPDGPPAAYDRKKVTEMVWDPSGERLAVATEGGTVTVYVVREVPDEPFVDLGIIGEIRDPDGSDDGSAYRPRLLRFCNQFPRGALLSVCWTELRARGDTMRRDFVMFYPLYFDKLQRFEM